MQINYLKKLQENPVDYLDDGSSNRGLNIQQIQELEILWNNGNPFPIVLKEYLFLAGEFCWAFNMKSPLTLRNIAVYQMNTALPPFTMPARPYIIIGVNTDSGSEDFTFIFLDETAADPMLYELNLFEEDQMEINDLQRIQPKDITLSDMINAYIEGFRERQATGEFPL